MSPYTITPESLASITAPEMVFGTTKLLPPAETIPEQFNSGANIYVQLVSAIFYGTPLPKGEIEFHPGFEQEQVVRCVRAHLTSCEPKHEHKMAGVAYMLSLMADLQETSS